MTPKQFNAAAKEIIDRCVAPDMHGNAMAMLQRATCEAEKAEMQHYADLEREHLGCPELRTGIYANESFVIPTHMVVCTKCGNKRCPHAQSERFKCTNSNDPGQIGDSVE